MTGKQLKITRSYKSVRFNAPETIDSRALSFLKSQNSTLDFSPEFSTKALTLKKKPSADNTVKRKKGKGAYTRYGVAVFNPNERWSPGKVFIPWIMKHGRGSGDDTPNVGWVTRPKTIEPKDVQKTVKELVAFRKTRAGYTYEDSKPNPRTGGFQEKALGPSIGTLVPGGDIGARAASKLGLVVDALGKLRCPAGVPAANQFTDSVGSNCFDFLPEVAKKLLEQSIQFGRQQMSDLRLLNNVEQTARRDSGLIVPSDTGLIVPNAQNLIIPHILGADGKILSITPTISPVVYAETVRAQLARDYPNIDMEERNRIVKLAEQRAGMVQTVNGKVKTALDYLTELGIEFDENDPQSLTAALLSGIQKLKENGWDIDYKYLLWGDDEMVNNESLSMEEKVALHIKGVINTAWAIISDAPERYLGEDVDKKFADLGGNKESERKRIVDAILNNDVSSLPPGHKVWAEAINARMMDYYASEHGFLMSILAEHKENPIDVELIGRFELLDPRVEVNQGTEAMVSPINDGIDDGKLAMQFNPIGMMMDSAPPAPTDGKWRLYKSNGNGLEISQIQEISRVVDAHQRKIQLNEFLKQANPLDSTNNKGKYLNSILEEHAGRLGRSMFIFQHELTHARQYSLMAYLISHTPDGKRLKGMTNAEVLNLVNELIQGKNSLMSYESVMSDPRVMASAFAEFGPMLETLVENGMSGAYPQTHLHAMNILSEVLSLPPSQRLQAAENLYRELNNLSRAKDAGFITTEEKQRLDALFMALDEIQTILQNPDDNTLEGAIRTQRALMVAEAIAELNAGVKMGLIQPTDEIKQVLEHINGSMDQVHKFKNSLEEHGRLKFVVEQDEFGRRIEKLDFNYFDRKKRTKGDITGESYTERQKRLIGDDDPITIMDSTESHKSKKSLVSHFSGIRERVMQRATEKQKKAINEELPEQNDARLITQDGLLISELADSSNIREGLSKGKTFDKKLEEDIIPILDLMENNPLEEDTAVVVDVGNVKRSKNPNRVTFMEFVNFVRAGIALNKQKYDTDDFPRENQKMIVKVPKGSRGIPDFDFAPRVPDSVVAPRQPHPTTNDDDFGVYSDIEVEELYRRYEEDKAKRRGPRGRRQSNDKMVDEEIRQVAAEKLRDQIERTRNRVAAGGLRSSSAPSRTTPVEKNLSVLQERAVESKERVANLQKALDVLERTGEWRGQEFGVVVSTHPDLTGDTGKFDADLPPVNLTKQEIEKRFGSVSDFANLVEKKLDLSKKEIVLAEHLAKTKEVRAQQNTLDIEDLTPEDFRLLLEEYKQLTPKDYGGAAVHVGQAELDGGILDPSKTSGGKDFTGQAGNTGALNEGQIFKMQRDNDSLKDSLTSAESILKSFNDGEKTYTPKDAKEAVYLNKLLGVDTSSFGAVGFEKGIEYDLSKMNSTGALSIINFELESIKLKIKENEQTLITMQGAGKFGFLSAYPASRDVDTGGYFARNAGSVIPKDIATYRTEVEAKLRQRPQYDDVKDEGFLVRWMSSLRGSAYLITNPSSISTNLGPSDERQILGKVKPVFGVSAPARGHNPLTSEDAKRNEWGKVTNALMARAIRLEKEGKEVNIQNVLTARRGEPLPDGRGPNRGLRSSSAPSRTTPEKIERGPTNLTYGRGEDGTPAMASIDELEQRYGKTPKEIKKYFSTRYGVDIGISKKIFKGTDTRDREKLNAAYGALQAMEDVFENVDIKALTGRDNLSIRLVAGATLDDSWGQFSAIEKWFSRTRFGDNNTKSGIDVNLENLTGSSSDPRGLSENYDRYWKEATVRDKVVGNMTAMFAQLGMPDGYEPQFPGLDDPGYKEWAAIAEEVRQRLAYGVMVHEIGHYLDFSQRDDSDETTPPLILSLLNGDFGSNRTDSPKIFGTDSSDLPDSFVDAPSVSRYGSSTKQEKLAEAFLSWFVIAGTERASRVDYLEPRDSETVSIIETYRQSINDILLPMFEKLGPRVKSAKKDKQSERFAMTSTLPLAALINSISPFTDILNKNKVSKSSPRGSISSMLLAPGKVKVVGTRKDGTLVGRLVQQDTPMKSLSRLEDKLKKFISNPHTNASHKVEARRALSVITARREAELATNSRSPSTQGGTAVLKIPLTINTNSKQILEKLEDIGATWGEPLSEAIAMKNTYSGGRSSLSNNTRFESDQQSIAIIDTEIKKLLSLMKKDKTAMKSLFPEVLKRIQSMTPDELKKNLVKAAREYVSGIDKRPRFRFSDNTVNSPESETTFDKFIDSGTWEVGSKNIDNPASVDAEYSLRLGVPEDVTSEIQLVRGHFLHKDEIRKRIIRAQSQIEKNRASFEDRGINPAKIKPEFLPESMSVGEYGEKDSLNPFSSQQGQIEVILKPETVHRTLMTLGDSFNEARTVINLDTDFSDEQLLIAILRTRWGGNGEVSGFKVTDLTTQQIIINLLNASIGKGGYGDITKGSEGNRHYSEAIIADGFNLDEVEEILLSVNYVKKQMGDSVVEPNLAQATQVLSRLSVNDDLINAENIILNPKTPTEVSAARELKKKIAYVQQIKKQRQLRAEFARRINASVRSGNGPRVVFPNIDGLDYDDPKTYKNYLENMSVDELLDERMANDVREIMKNLGRKVATSEQVRQARQKPKAEVGAS